MDRQAKGEYIAQSIAYIYTCTLFLLINGLDS